MKISFCITACNEHVELESLLDLLSAAELDYEFEIIVQLDSTYTKEVESVCGEFRVKNPDINYRIVIGRLRNDFASFKNNLFQYVTGDYLFQIDADELPSLDLLRALPDICKSNVDVVAIPRINIVNGINESHIRKWRWNVNSKNWINFPDYQVRILRNVPEIRWKNKVHEVVTGYKTYAKLEGDENWCEYYLYHEKTITKQETQNSLYDSIM